MKASNRRTLRSLLVRPKRQLAMAATIAMIGTVGLGVISVIGAFVIRHVLATLTHEYNIDDAAAENAARTLLMSLGLVGAIGVVSILAAMAFVIILSHRIYGPVVAIQTQIDRLVAGDYASRVTLRRHDEFTEVADKLNRLSAALEVQFAKDSR